MRVGNWAQYDWTDSAVSNKTLHVHKNVLGRGVESPMDSKGLDEFFILTFGLEAY